MQSGDVKIRHPKACKFIATLKLRNKYFAVLKARRETKQAQLR